ncbi:S8 family serine peptidase [Xanthomonadaceae bacterium XH05]|nr:S8 family serine peptidase [Xanthomonadaceae bacterium XH05]
MLNSRCSSILLSSVFAVSGFFPAQAAESDFLLDLGGQHFDLLTQPPRAAHVMGEGSDLRLVQFTGPIQPEWLQRLREDGVEPLQYIHPYSYVVWSDAAALARASAHAHVRASGDFIAEFRIGEGSRNLGGEAHPAVALLVRDANVSARNASLQAAGVTIDGIFPFDSRFDIAQVTLAGNRYAELASLPGVYAVQRIVPITAEEAKRGEMSQQSVVGAYGGAPNYIVVPGYEDWLASTGYDGSGVVVGIVDGGVLATHQDLVGRIEPCVPMGGTPTSCSSITDDHGTHVAAAVAGTGASAIQAGGFLRGQGVAPGAKVVPQRYNAFLSGGGPGGMVAGGMLRIYRESALSGAVLTNNSWGPSTTPRGYDIVTREVDMIARDALTDVPGQQPVLPVWSIMNGNGDSSGACAPASVGSPDEAKNLFAVGSTNLLSGSSQASGAGIFNVSSNSAHGNACDGRRIPHIVAPGCSTDSATNSGPAAFTRMCGTSMASPVVSGAIALFIERYRDAHDGATPSPALVKAAFTAAAMNLQGYRNADNGVMGHRPDRFQGYGRLDLDAVMNPPDSVLYFDQDEVFTASGQMWTRTVTAADPSRPMRFMLAWTDAPGHGLGGTTPAWVNDLDLSVTAGGDLYRGNVIGNDGWSATGGSADARNNLEGAFLSAAQHGGAVTLTVIAANIGADALNPHAPGLPSQDFALACYNCAAGADFNVEVSPTRVAVCAPELAQTMVSVLPVGMAGDDVVLSVSDLPAGASATFGVATLPLPGSTTLTIGNTASIAPGSHALLVEASGSTVTRSAAFDLLVAAGAPPQPALVSPANGADSVSTTPVLGWNAAAGVDEYLVELSADASFSLPLFSATTTDTSAIVTSELDTGASYYWRVTASNTCDVVMSEIASFRTAQVPGDCAPGSEPVLLFSEDFSDGAGDFSVSGTGASNWAISTNQPSLLSGGNAMYADAIATVSDQQLTSPVITLPEDESPLLLSFQNWRLIQTNSQHTGCWDGGILEISTDGVNFSQIVGPTLLNDPYRGLVGGAVNPLAGKPAWCEPVERPYADTRVDLSAWAGLDVQLRWRLGTDNALRREGWYVDDVRVRSCRPVVQPATEIFADGFESAGI